MPYWYDALAGGEDITATRITAEVTNADSVTLVRGDVVYLFGATGNRASVKLASNVGDVTSATTFGIVEDTIAPNNIGTVVTQGVIDGLNLGAYSPGDIVWLATTAGDFTKVKPIAPYHSVFLGVVERANAGNGQIYVKVQNGYELGELHNVLINSPVGGSALVYNSATSVWVDGPVVTRVDALPRTAVTITQGLSGGEMCLTYFTAPNDITITKIAVARSATVPSATGRYLALYSEDPATGNLTLVAETGNNAAILATSYTETATLAPYTITAGQRYAIGVLFSGVSAAPNLLCTQTGLAITGGIDEMLAASPRVSAQTTGTLTSPPSSITASTGLTITKQAVMYLGVLA